MITDDELKEIQARALAATPGPWEPDVDGSISQHWTCHQPWGEIVSTDVECLSCCYGGRASGVANGADREFIAHARTDVPRLVAEIWRAKAEAWDEGYMAGHEDARAVQPAYPQPTPNPYTDTQQEES